MDAPKVSCWTHIFCWCLFPTFDHCPPPCDFVYSVGAESECFRWISRENHFSLIAVGSWKLCCQTGLRARLLRHDELAPIEINANEVGYFLCHDYLPFLRVWNQAFRLRPLNSNEFTWRLQTALREFSFQALAPAPIHWHRRLVLGEWISQIERAAMHLTVRELVVHPTLFLIRPLPKAPCKFFSLLFCNFATRYPLFVLRSMNSGIRSHSESQTKESRKRLYLQTVTEGDIQYESFPISVCVWTDPLVISITSVNTTATVYCPLSLLARILTKP